MTESTTLEELQQELKQAEAGISRYDNLQMAMKILLNGGYGAVANKHFLYYEVANAEAITLTGQLVNQWTCIRVNKFLNEVLKTEDYDYWVYADTDSGYFSLKPFVDKICPDETPQRKTEIVDEFVNGVVSPKIEEICQELSDYLNSYEQRMFWEREVIAESGIWVAKKRYAMAVWDNEGVKQHSEPELKVTGLESVRSSTPGWAREMLKKCYKIALTGNEDELHEFIDSSRGEFDKLDTSTIAMPRGINEIDKWVDSSTIYKKGTPKHVKGSIIHNWMLKEKDITDVDPITSGDKIKFIDLKRPNPINQDVIAFDTFIPERFELEEYVDRDLIWEKSFMSPLKIFLKAIDWREEPTNSLFDFM